MKYKDFAPTGYDNKGTFLDDRQDWVVAPATRTRDSGPLDESNFDGVLDLLGGESDTVEVHRFGHWGPGWFEIILVHPDREDEVNDIKNRLDEYPILDEEDLSIRESDDAQESWNNWGASAFVDEITNVFMLSENAEDLLRGMDKDKLWEFHSKFMPEPYISESSGTTFNFDYVSTYEQPSRSDVARLLLEARSTE